MSRRIPLIAGALVVLLLLIWFVALWRPAVAESHKATASRTAAKALEITLGDRLASLVAQQKSLCSDETKLRQGQVAVPTSVSLDTVIDQINAIALADQISWTNESQSSDAASPSAPPSSSGTVSSSDDSTLTLSLQVAGSYTNMAKFITDLEHRPRLIVLDTLSYSPGPSSAVTVSMTARAFYNPTASPMLPNTCS
jgi:Tfp pilus assembly protein PilO